MELVLNLTWDANAATATQTNGAGAWLGTNQWWDGAANQTWASGSSATFGGPATAGGAVTLASPTTANTITFNPFTGTYTLGTAAQALTVNGGITINSTAAAVTIVSPVTVGATQTWTNNSASAMTLSGAITTGTNSLNVAGSGSVTIGAVALTGTTGGITLSGSGLLDLRQITPTPTFSGTTTVSGGVMRHAGNLSASSNVVLNGGVLEDYFNTTFTRTLGVGAGQIQLTGGAGGFGENGDASIVNLGNAAATITWGTATFQPTAFILGAFTAQANSIRNSVLTFANPIDLNGATRTVRVDQIDGTGGAGTTQRVGNGSAMSANLSNGTGTAGLIKTGVGRLSLNGTNTYNGGTTISAGTLRFPSLVSMPATGAVAVQGGAVLGVSVGSASQWTTGTSGNGTIGGLLAGIGGQAGSTVTYSGNVGLELNNSTNQTYSGGITDLGTTLGLIKTGAGVLTLAGNNSYTGLTRVFAGTLLYGKTAALYGGTSASWTAANLNVQNGGTLAFSVGGSGEFSNGDVTTLMTNLATSSSLTNGMNAASSVGFDTTNAGGTFTIANILADSTGTNGGARGVAKLGTGTLVLSGASTYTGVTTVTGGTLNLTGSIKNGGINLTGAFQIGTATPANLGGGDITLNTNGALSSNGTTARTVTNRIVMNGNFTLGDATNNGMLTFTTAATSTTGSAQRTITCLSDAQFNTPVGGTGGINKLGSGTTLTLTGLNTYTAATNVSAGTLTMSGGNSATSATITVGSSGNTGVILNITGGTYTLGTNGILAGTGAAGQTGTINQSVGTVNITSSGGNGILVGNGSGTGIYNLSGGSIVNAGSTGTIRGVMIGVNTGASGTFNLSGGTLDLSTASAALMIGRSDAASNNTTAAYNQTSGTAMVGTLTIGGAATSGSTGVNASFSATGGTFTATNFTLLSAAGTNTSTMTIGGTATVTLPAFPTARGSSSTATLYFDGGTLKNSAAGTTYMGGLNNAFIKSGGAVLDTTNGSITITQNLLTDSVSTGGSLTKSGSNTLTLSGTNTYTGATNINGGALQAGAAAGGQAFGIGSAVTLANSAGVTLDLNNFNQTIGSLAGGGATGGNVTLGSATLTTGGNNSNTSFGGVISGTSGSLIKTGAGTLTLTGASTYTGTTTVSSGKLFINGSLSNTAVALNVSNGATLGGTGTIGRDVTIANGGKLEFDISTSAVSHDRLDVSSGRSFTFTGTSTLTITSSGGLASGTYTLMTGGNNITGSAPATVNMPAGWAATVSISGNSLLLNVSGAVDHFAISSINSPQTVGTPITGITLTAQDAANVTATSFTGTVTFGGSGGLSGTSASFIAGVLTGVNIIPTVAGSNLTFTVTDGASPTPHTGTTIIATIATPQSPYDVWSGTTAFDADSNGDGVKNGLAWLLGSANKNVAATALLPVPSTNAGKLMMTFDCLSTADRGSAALNLQYSKNLGVADPWSGHTVAVPGVVGITTVNSVKFTATANGPLILKRKMGVFVGHL